MLLPHSAASIITPMMLLPFTAIVVARELDLGGEAGGQPDELRRRPGVQPEGVHDLDRALDHSITIPPAASRMSTTRA